MHLPAQGHTAVSVGKRFKPSSASQSSATLHWLTGVVVHPKNVDVTELGCVWQGQLESWGQKGMYTGVLG